MDLQEVVRKYQEAAAEGNVEAQIKLGYLYSKGEGVKQNHQKAHELYTAAIAQEIKAKQSSTKCIQ